MQFGNMNIAKKPIGNFEGLNKKSKVCKKSNASPVPNEDLLPIAPIAKYLHLKQQLQKVSNGNNVNEQKELQAKLDKMEAVSYFMSNSISAILFRNALKSTPKSTQSSLPLPTRKNLHQCRKNCVCHPVQLHKWTVTTM
jgi:hypothetical protein